MKEMNYDEYYSPQEQVELRNHALDEAVLAFAKPFQKILDVGAGAGVLASKLKNMGKDVTCMDIKQNYVEYMKQFELLAITGDANNIPFKDKEFDLVICEEVLEHLANPGEGLKELCRVGKNVIFTLPKMHPDSWHLWDIDFTEDAGCLIVKMMERGKKNA